MSKNIRISDEASPLPKGDIGRDEVAMLHNERNRTNEEDAADGGADGAGEKGNAVSRFFSIVIHTGG